MAVGGRQDELEVRVVPVGERHAADETLWTVSPTVAPETTIVETVGSGEPVIGAATNVEASSGPPMMIGSVVGS